MKRKKKVLIIIGVLAAVAVGVMVFRPRDTGTAAFPVELSPLQKTTLRSTISTNGNVESTDSVNVDLSGEGDLSRGGGPCQRRGCLVRVGF